MAPAAKPKNARRLGKVRALLPQQPQIQVVHQRRRLNGAGPLAAEKARRHRAQLGIDLGDQVVERGGVAVAPLLEQERQIARVVAHGQVPERYYRRGQLGHEP